MLSSRISIGDTFLPGACPPSRFPTHSKTSRDESKTGPQKLFKGSFLPHVLRTRVPRATTGSSANSKPTTRHLNRLLFPGVSTAGTRGTEPGEGSPTAVLI